MMNGNEIDMALSFIPLLSAWVTRVFVQGWLSGCARRSSPERAAEGISSMLMREREFQICLQFTLSFLRRSRRFVCLLSILMTGNSYGQMDYRISNIFLYDHPFISAIPTGCTYYMYLGFQSSKHFVCQAMISLVQYS